MRHSAPQLAETREPALRADEHSARSTIEVGDSDALASVSAHLADADPNVRMDAASDLGSSHDPRAEWLLAIVAVQDPEPSVRTEALYALGSLRTVSQFATFQSAIRDVDLEVRKAAIGALEDLGGDAAVDILRIARNDSDSSIRFAAAEALSDLGAGDASVP